MKNPPALLLMAYGAPDTANDIEAYYTDIRHGRPPSKEQLEELRERYAAIGGKSPLLEITKEQTKKLGKKLGLQPFLGMKHWHPTIPEAVEQIATTGATEIVAMVLAPHFSSMSIADYRARLDRAIAEIKPGLKVTMIERWGDNPLFIESICERMEITREKFSSPKWEDIEVLFSAHSLHTRILREGDPYLLELTQTAELVANKLDIPHWQLIFQSAGRTADTWIGPDILEVLPTLATQPGRQVLSAPIGFTVDNLEILYDLDIEAAQLAKQLGLELKRIPVPNATPKFIDALESVVRPVLAS